MRKLIGLCFLTATLLATSAHAQGIYIDRGDPNTISAAAGGKYLLNDSSWGGSVAGSWSYRGVFDAGAELTYLKYMGGNNKNLAGIAFMPFVTWYALRAEEDELPISMSVSMGVAREFFTGNAPVANPEGWGLFLGPSVYRRMQFGENMTFVPEALVAYDLKATRYYSGALDQTSGNVRDLSGATGYATEMKHSGRVLLRLNLLVKAGNTRYTIVPYAGYQSGVTVGGNVGAIF